MTLRGNEVINSGVGTFEARRPRLLRVNGDGDMWDNISFKQPIVRVFEGDDRMPLLFFIANRLYLGGHGGAGAHQDCRPSVCRMLTQYGQLPSEGRRDVAVQLLVGRHAVRLYRKGSQLHASRPPRCG